MASRTPTRSPGKKLHNDVVESSANAFSDQFRRIFLNLSRLSLSKRHRVFYALNSTGHPVLGCHLGKHTVHMARGRGTGNIL